MKRIIYFVIILMLMSGCYYKSLGHLDKLRTENRQNLLKLSIGISKQEALGIMGNATATDIYINEEKVTASNPYKNEILQGKDKTFEVIYYLTESKHQKVVDYWGYSQATPITEDELTPLVFDNGKLIGWGWSFLKNNSQTFEIRMR
ncbi:MAG: DUF3192 domain-containing protein [Deltaproteobacteria bacterium]